MTVNVNYSSNRGGPGSSLSANGSSGTVTLHLFIVDGWAPATYVPESTELDGNANIYGPATGTDWYEGMFAVLIIGSGSFAASWDTDFPWDRSIHFTVEVTGADVALTVGDVATNPEPNMQGGSDSTVVAAVTSTDDDPKIGAYSPPVTGAHDDIAGVMTPGDTDYGDWFESTVSPWIGAGRIMSPSNTGPASAASNIPDVIPWVLALDLWPDETGPGSPNDGWVLGVTW